MSTYYIGYDIGSSSIKVSLVDTESGKNLASLHEPQNEMEILSLQKDWAEQDPNLWWKHICTATKKVISTTNVDATKIVGIGIAYQMHGLVIVDKHGNPLRNSIIWCDSRAIEIGDKAFEEFGVEKWKHVQNMLTAMQGVAEDIDLQGIPVE